MLRRIQIKGFKSLRSMDVDLQRINVFIGANGVGKSNFLSFFRMLNFLTSKGLQVYIARAGGADMLLYYGSKHTARLECSLTFDTDQGTNIYEMSLVSAAGDTLIFTDERACFNKKDRPLRPLMSLGQAGHRETVLDESTVENVSGVGRYIRSAMSMWRVYHFHDTSPEARMKKKCSIYDNEYLRDDAGNLASFLYRLRSESLPYYSRIVDTVRQFVPWFGDFVLKPDAENPGSISLAWRERSSDYLFSVDQLSDGTVRMIALITLLLQPQLPSCIILDEPELGLHPYALNMLADLLKAASLKSQVLLATQSAHLVDQFAAKDVVVAERKDNQTVFDRLNEEHLAIWLQEYSLGELWEKNVFGGRPSL
ncbi:MAG: hypothetical protein DDT39_01565 [Firmicutes bacterium]|nr:hypothetical protein [candidate division NPL-UPA2 bacterium]